MKRFFPLALAALALGLGAVVASPARVGAQSIIVNPAPFTDLGVRTWVDRDPTGQGTSSYRVGELIRVGVSVTRDAYVYLFNVNADGEISLILPNGYSGGENFLYAGETRTFPAPGAGYQFRVDGPTGYDRVLALASSEQLDMSELYDIQANGFYDVQVQGAPDLARALSIVVEPVASRAWVTDVVQYRVRY